MPPIPRPDPETRPYWDAAREGRLDLQRCTVCDLLVWYPRRRCHRCGADELRWETLSGHGSVYSFTVVHRAPDPSVAVPYVVALVDLIEGARVMTNLVDLEPDAIRIGLPVAVRFRPLGDELSLPVFGPLS